VNSIFVLLGIESWKPLLAALVLPPVPFLLMMLIGARLILPRRGLGWFVIILSVLLLWFGSCTGTAQLMSQFMLRPPPALTLDRIKDLKSQPRTAIVILGAGMEPFAPEYGVSNLTHTSLERLRYGLWLSRETSLPVAFSGGVGWAQSDGMPEARVAAQIAATEFGRPLKWVEENSRDTRENAGRSVALLRTAGIKNIVLVTHGYHMPRAVEAFAIAGAGDMQIEAAPMGLARGGMLPALMWMPTSKGIVDVRDILRELLGRLAGS
jgi:uncharacterized SAM-binding protein YcdF (DUF218 family)